MTVLQDIQDMSQNIIKWGLTRFLGNSHVCQSLKSGCFIAARAIGAHNKYIFNV